MIAYCSRQIWFERDFRSGRESFSIDTILRMTQTPQQRQTLEYFNQFAGNWRQKAEGLDAKKKFNVIAARNNCVLHVADTMGEVKTALDVGCGTGELVIDLAKKGIDALGIDFAPDMIFLCKEKALKEDVKKASFMHASVYDYAPAGVSYDLIAANGFIEYVSDEELDRFLAHMATLVSPQGRLVVGSRNRLFNVHSLNDFTTMEKENGCLGSLVDESMCIANAKDQQSLIKDLAGRTTAYPRHERHPDTGIGVAVRYQYTPAELVGRMAHHGFETVALVPVHYHGMTPAMKAEHPEIHVHIAELLQSIAEDSPALIPFASTFMLTARLASKH